MTPMRWFYVLFWLFVGSMLAWQAYDYNANLVTHAHENPPEKHYFYNPAPTAPAAPAHPGPYVIQRAFRIDIDTPPGSFTCHVTLQNQGSAKATGVQIFVRPYRGTITTDPNTGHNHSPLSDTDPISMIGQWVAFPDLGPGESSTQDVVFASQQNIDQRDNPGMDPDPQIIYQPEKTNP